MELFLNEFLTYLFKFVVLLLIAIGGCFFGKFLRTRKMKKNSKSTNE